MYRFPLYVGCGRTEHDLGLSLTPTSTGINTTESASNDSTDEFGCPAKTTYSLNLHSMIPSLR